MLKDSQSGKVLAQIKFKSISDKRIKAVKIRIFSFDVTGASVGDAVEHQYLDLNVNRNDEFGSKEAASLPLYTTRSFRAQISNIVYSDDSIWEAANDAEWIPLTAQQKLSSVLKDAELVKQYTIETGSKGEFVPKETADLWLCSCGTINHKSEDHCVSCKKALPVLIKALDISMLTEKMHARIKEQRISEEKTAETQNQKQEAQRQLRQIFAKKLVLIIGLVSVFCILAVILAIKVFIPLSKYNTAIEMLNSGNYTGAISQFSSLGDYKDSESQILATYYAEGEEYMKTKNYSDAVDFFAKAGSYKDAADKVNTAQTYSSYESAEKEFAEGNLNSAYEIYKKLPVDFENAKERITLIEPYLSICGTWKEMESYSHFLKGGQPLQVGGQKVDDNTIQLGVVLINNTAYLVFSNDVGVLCEFVMQEPSMAIQNSEPYTFYESKFYKFDYSPDPDGIAFGNGTFLKYYSSTFERISAG